MRTLVVIPTYNERENIESIVAGVLGLERPGLEILIVDDASPDGTGRLADTLATNHAGRVRVLHRPAKSGLGSAYIAGFRMALEKGFDAACEMDADGSHAPESLPQLLDAVERGDDVAIGSRRVKGGRVIGWGPHRHLMSWGAMSFSRLLLGMKTHDITAGFRCYRRRAIEAILRLPIASSGYAFQEETLYYCEKLGFRIAEVPIIFRDRVRGGSKLSYREVPAFFSTILRLRRTRLAENKK
jgi:glycosyltransferase involved in cell wall biosynthesis